MWEHTVMILLVLTLIQKLIVAIVLTTIDKRQTWASLTDHTLVTIHGWQLQEVQI